MSKDNKIFVTNTSYGTIVGMCWNNGGQIKPVFILWILSLVFWHWGAGHGCAFSLALAWRDTVLSVSLSGWKSSVTMLAYPRHYMLVILSISCKFTCLALKKKKKKSVIAHWRVFINKTVQIKRYSSIQVIITHTQEEPILTNEKIWRLKLLSYPVRPDKLIIMHPQDSSSQKQTMTNLTLAKSCQQVSQKQTMTNLTLQNSHQQEGQKQTMTNLTLAKSCEQVSQKQTMTNLTFENSCQQVLAEVLEGLAIQSWVQNCQKWRVVLKNPTRLHIIINRWSPQMSPKAVTNEPQSCNKWAPKL